MPLNAGTMNLIAQLLRIESYVILREKKTLGISDALISLMLPSYDHNVNKL